MHAAKLGQKLIITCIGYDSIHKESVSHCSSNRACADKAGDPLGAATYTVSAPCGFQAHYATAGCWHSDAATPIIACTSHIVHSCKLARRQNLRLYSVTGYGTRMMMIL